MKTMSLADCFAQRLDFVGGEIDDPTAATTNHVIVRVFTVGVLIVSLFDVESDLLENSAIHQERQRPIDRGFSDLLAAFSQQVEHLLGLEVLVQVQNRIQNDPPGDRVLDAVCLQIPAERVLDVNRCMLLLRALHAFSPGGFIAYTLEFRLDVIMQIVAAVATQCGPELFLTTNIVAPTVRLTVPSTGLGPWNLATVKWSGGVWTR